MKKDDATTDREHLSKIAKNAGISGIGEIVFNIIGYATSIVITRSVGASVYGVFSLANIIVWVAQIFSSAGMSEGVLRFVAFYKGRDDMPRMKGSLIFGSRVSLVLSLFFMVGLYCTADLMADRLFHDPDVAFSVKVLIISLPFLTLGELWLRAIQSLQAVKYQVYIQKFYQPIIKIAVLTILFFAGLKLVGLLIASVVSVFFGFVLALLYLTRLYPFHRGVPKPVYEKREMIHFSLPLSMTQLLGVMTFYIDSLMLGYFKTTTEVGVYTVVTRLAILIILPLTAVNTIFAPMISEFYSKQQMNRLAALFKTATKWIFVLSFPVFLVLVLFAEPIMGIFGTGFVIGSIALIILACGELVNAGVGSVGYMLMMTGRAKIVMLNSIVFCILNIVLNYLLIPPHGIIGAAIATGTSLAIVNIMRVIEVYVLLNIQPFKLNYLKPLLSGLISCFLVYFVRDYFKASSLIAVVVQIFFFLALYGIFMFLSKLDEDDEYILNLIYTKVANARAVVFNSE
ncbi:MAG: flippase [Nitrospiraceae bacterium]|nr:MAG: flippase [Nitrospiraceae bacterium]